MTTIEPISKIAVDPWYPVSIEPQRVDRIDELGQLIGYTLISSSEWGRWVDHYDLADRLVGGRYEDGHGFTSEWSQQLDELSNVIESRFESSDGSWEAANRVPPPAVPFGAVGLSHALSTKGFWPGFGTFSRLEVFDLNGSRVHSRASYADGSSDLYAIAPVVAEDGSIVGYSGLWTWTGADGSTSSWSEALDLNLLPLWTVMDDPSVMPLAKEMGASKAAGFGGGPLQKPLVSDRDSLDLSTTEHQQFTHGFLTGRRDLRLRGNALDNVLVGNDGRNRIDGGRGSDQISGGDGKDRFVLRLHVDDVDTITDFDPSRDKLVLKGQPFSRFFRDGELRSGVLNAELRFEASTDTLLFTVDAASVNASPIALAVLPGLSPRLLDAQLFQAG